MPTVAQLDIQVEADIASAVGNLATVDALLNKLAGEDSDVTVDADTASAVAEVAALEKALSGIGDEKVHVDVETDFALAQVRGLEGEIRALKGADVPLDVDIARAKAAIKDVQSDLVELRDEHVSIEADADITGALYKLQLLNAEATALGRRKVEIEADVDVDTHDIARARNELRTLAAEAANAGRDMDRTVRTVIGLAPLIAPALLAATAGLGAIAAGAIAAGVGTVGFGAVAVGVFKPIADGLNKINTAQQAYTYAVTDEQRKSALEREKAAWDSLTDSQVKMVKGIQAFTDSWRRFAHQFEPAIFDLAARGLSRLSQLLPRFAPIVQSVATAFSDMGTRLSRALDTPRYQEFFDFIARQSGPTLNAWATALGNVVEGLLSMSVAFEPLLNEFNAGFVAMTRRFAEWAAGLRDNAAFQEFVGYVREYTPIVLSFIGSLARAFWELVEALAPLGARIMPILTDFFNAFSDFMHDNPMLAQVFAGILGFFTAIIGFAGPLRAVSLAVKLVWGALKFLFALLGGASLGTIGLVAGIILAIGAAAVWAYGHIDGFRRIVDQAWAKLKEFASSVWPVLQAAWQSFVTWFQTYIGPAVQAVVDFVVAEWNKMKDWAATNAPLFKAAWDQIVAALQAAWTSIVGLFQYYWPVIKAIWNDLWPSLVIIVTAVWTIIKGVISGALEIIRGFITLFAGLIAGDWGAVWEGAKMIVSGAWTAIVGIVQGGLLLVIGILGTVGALVVSAFRLMWAAMVRTVQQYGNLIGAAASRAMAFVRGRITNFLSNIWPTWSAAWSRMSAWVTSTGFRISAAVQAFLGRVVASIRAQVASAAASWSTGWNRMAAVASAVVARIRGAVSAFLAGIVARVRQGISQVVSGWTSGWARVASAASSAGARIRGIVSGLISSIVSLVYSMGSRLYSAGYAAFSNFASGVAAAGARAVAAARSVVAQVAGLMPGSPAEWGPLSGKGYVKLRGERFMEDFAAGLRSQENLVRSAALDMAGLLSFNVNAAPQAAAVGPISSGGGDIDRLIAAITNNRAQPAGPQFNYTIHNPREETTSESTNKTLQRAASLNWGG